MTEGSEIEANSTSEVGRIGENAALDVYRNRGYRVVARNWRCPLGELDLVLLRGEMLVICEVKTRRGSTFGGGYEGVTARKRAKVRALAEAFLRARPGCPETVRFDVASVALRAGLVEVELFEDAF